MASEASDPERLKLSFFSGVIKKQQGSGDEIGSEREPLIDGERSRETCSIGAAILPFLFPALGGMLYGYDIGATSGATISIQSSTLSGITWYDLDSVEIGLVVSGSLYGALIGSVLAFTIADFLGRRRELIVSSMLYFLGALLTALAPNFPIMVIGRFVYGIGIGLVGFVSLLIGILLLALACLLEDKKRRCYILFFYASCIPPSVHSLAKAMHAAPMYIAETAPAQIRGTLISMKEFFIVIGMLLGYIASSLYVDVIAGWRYMYASSAPVCLIMGIGMWWLPPSPRWLLLCTIQGNGNLPEAKEIAICCLCRLRGQAVGDSASEQVDAILDELASSVEEKEGGFLEIFQGKGLKALIIGAGLVFFQQITGQPSVLYYAATILQSAGFSAASDATRVSILIGTLKLVMTGVAVLVVDRLGRRPLLIGGVSGIAVSLFLLSSYYTLFKDSAFVAVIALLLYVGCYQLSFGPIGWLMISEIFPLRLRGRGLSIAVLVNFASNALVTFAFSPLEELVGTGILFAGFGVIALVSLLFIFFFVPETKGLTLEEIETKIL